MLILKLYKAELKMQGFDANILILSRYYYCFLKYKWGYIFTAKKYSHNDWDLNPALGSEKAVI